MPTTVVVAWQHLSVYIVRSRSPVSRGVPARLRQRRRMQRQPRIVLLASFLVEHPAIDPLLIPGIVNDGVSSSRSGGGGGGGAVTMVGSCYRREDVL